MLRYTLFLLLIFTGQVMLYAQFDWAAQTSGTNQALADVFFTSKNKGWVVGSGGVILHTSNRGNTWTAQTSGTTDDLSSVFFIDENNGWVAGGNFVMGYPVILHTTNGGQTWVNQTISATESVTQIVFASETIGYACTTFGFYKTTNSGTSWQTVNTGFGGQHFCVDFSDASTGWIGCAAGKILRTTNGGTSWTTIDAGTSSNIYAIDFIDANTGWFCCSSGEIRKTTNGGLTWQLQETFNTNLLFDIRFIDANNGYSVGSNGKFLHTSDGGTTWNQGSTGTSQSTYGVFFYDQLNGWIAAAAGNLRCTTEEEKICLVTVDTLTGKNLVIWERTPGRQTLSYNIYKRIGAQYLLAGNVPYNDMSVYLDVLSAPEVSADRYAVRAVDNEGVESRISPYHQTVNLGVSVGVPATTITLNWSSYVDESGEFTPDYYYIYRSANPTGYALYDSVSSAFTSYNDLNVTSPYYYKIAVSKNTDCLPSSTKDVSVYRMAFSNADQGVQGANLLTGNKMISVSPNPVKDILRVDLDKIVENAEYKISDIHGRVLISGIEKGIKSFPLNLENLSPGCYLLQIRDKNNVIRTTLMKE